MQPGAEIVVTIIREGKEAGQGVAYLDDGTMVVVEHGRQHLGRTVPVIVSSFWQTAAGTMLFANLREEAAAYEGPRQHIH